jgi:hypothetical protein
MKALSMDLRERVAKAKGTGSSYEVADRFAVKNIWVRKQPDLTIDEIRARYRVERSVVVSESAMRRTVNRLGLSRKKRRFSRRSAKAKKSRPRATNTWQDGSVWSPAGVLP